MAEVQDIDLIENELSFADGDFNVEFSDPQHQEDIIAEEVGSYKQYPLLGVGVLKYLNSSGSELVLKRSILVQLETDGYYVNEVRFNKSDVSEFTVDAERRT
tara:strand:+ start:12338 stop:12643 length:306 start_codon:yes stop_codon:yes gene_type:complete